jgi:hypothetical protein
MIPFMVFFMAPYRTFSMVPFMVPSMAPFMAPYRTPFMVPFMVPSMVPFPPWFPSLHGLMIFTRVIFFESIRLNFLKLSINSEIGLGFRYLTPT